ncbi:MAG: diaminopimelate epimerase [Nitrospinota bacterium]
MPERIPFVKMQGSGNDFILIDNRSRILDPENLGDFIRGVCRRCRSVGADGLILLEESDRADFRWHYFNADGGRAEMCGNGSRCAARLAHRWGMAPANLTFETDAGILSAEVTGRRVKVRMTDPSPIDPAVKVTMNGFEHHLHWINTGVPHAVEFVEDLEGWKVVEVGRFIRFHERFLPAGTNVDFVHPVGRSRVAVRTYERGVEEETLACGTGAVAAALVCADQGFAKPPVDVLTRSGDELRISFRKEGKQYTDVYLEGETALVYEGSLTQEAWT